MFFYTISVEVLAFSLSFCVFVIGISIRINISM